MLPGLYSYAWAAGHNVALASLHNVETDIGARNRRDANSALRRVGISSQPVDAFPIRRRVMSGRERGDGNIAHEWTMILAALGVKYVLTQYLSSGTVASAAMTINTRRHELGDYARYNCYLVLPKPGEDIEYLRSGVFRVRWRFVDLEKLA